MAAETVELDEVAPVESEPLASCPECGEQFSGGGRHLSLGRHRKAAHPETWVRSPKTDELKRRKAEGRTSLKGAKPAGPRGVESKPVQGQPPRQPAGWLFSMCLQGIGAAMVMTNKEARTGAAINLEAPLAGMKIDNAIAGTFVDRRIVQGLLAGGASAKDLGLVVGFPALVWMADHFPQFNVHLRPFQEMVLAQVLMEVKNLPKSELADVGEAKEFAEAMAKESGGPGWDQMLETLFPHPPQQEEPDPEPQPVREPEPVAA